MKYMNLESRMLKSLQGIALLIGIWWKEIENVNLNHRNIGRSEGPYFVLFISFSHCRVYQIIK